MDPEPRELVRRVLDGHSRSVMMSSRDRMIL